MFRVESGKCGMWRRDPWTKLWDRLQQCRRRGVCYVEGFAEVRPIRAPIKTLDTIIILTWKFLYPAPARCVRGSGTGTSIPLRMSRLVAFAVFGTGVTITIEFEFYNCRSYKVGNTGSVSLSSRLVQIAQNLVAASLAISSDCSNQS